MTERGEVADHGFDIFIEVLVAVATGFMLVGVAQLGTESDKPFIETIKAKIPEISVVFILIFSVQVVSKGAALFEPAVKQLNSAVTVIGTGATEMTSSLGALKELQEGLEVVKKDLGLSAEHVRQARYASLAARVLGIRNLEQLMIPGVDGTITSDAALASITERALDSIQAWIQTGFRIDETSGNAGPVARQTWWRIMEAYHREEVFDVTQLEVATNVRIFDMMLLVAIGYHMTKLAPNERLVLVNVSKFPPKDFFNFPDGNAYNRFYHEPEFFGTYRRALSAFAKHPQICPLRVFLCGPGNDVVPFQLVDDLRSDEEMDDFRDIVATVSSNPVGMDSATKIAYDCAFMSFLPIPLTFPFEEDASSPHGDVPDDVQYFRDRSGDVFKELPRGVDRALINPYYRWLPKSVQGGPDSWYHRIAIGKMGFVNGDKFRSDSDRWREHASSLLDTGLAVARANDVRIKPADFKGQLDTAWHDLIKRCLGFGWGTKVKSVADEMLFPMVSDAKTTLGKLLALDKDDIAADCLAAELSDSVRPYEQEYLRYVESVEILRAKYERCVIIAAKVYSASASEFDDLQNELVELELELLTRCQTIDSLDKYLDLMAPQDGGPRAMTASTGLRLGYAENWLHRALIYLEGIAIRQEVHERGPTPLWKLLASDLCGLWFATHDLGRQFDEFFDCISRRIRIYDPSDDKASVLDEFLLLGVANCDDRPDASGTMPTFHPEVENVRWKALIGTNINEPFHTCRIQFDFGDDGLTRKDAVRPPVTPAERRPGMALGEHAHWFRTMWGKKDATERFKLALRAKWCEMRPTENTADLPVEGADPPAEPK